MKNVAIVTKSALCMCLFMVLVNACSKVDINGSKNSTSSSERLAYSEPINYGVDSVFVADTMTRTFTVYDNCKLIIGTITTNGLNHLRYFDQTTTTISIIGNGAQMTLNKNALYYFVPSGTCAGNRILRVRFTSGTQSLCNTFFLTGCSWTYNANGCTAINSWAAVSALPTPC